MKFLSNALVRGLLIVVPVYFAVLVLLKGMQSVANLVHPLAQLLPDWLPAEQFLSLLLVLRSASPLALPLALALGKGSGTGRKRPSLKESRATDYSGASRTRSRGKAAEVPGRPRWSRSKKPLSRRSSSKSSRTGATRSLSRRSPRRLRVPSTWSTGNGCTLWTCPSPMRSQSSHPMGFGCEEPGCVHGERRQARRTNTGSLAPTPPQSGLRG